MLRPEAISNGDKRIARTVDDLESYLHDGALAMVVHPEGAEPVEPSLDNLDDLYRLGVRSLGITWSRPNAFGYGVPFRFPASPDTGPGLADAGMALVRRCSELGMLIDVPHLNEARIWDVARTTEAPVVATHSAANTICPVTRHLTDRVELAIRGSDGLVGVNVEVSAMRPDSLDAPATPIEVLVTQIAYLVERVGTMGQRGYDHDLIEWLAWRNWM